MKLITEKEGLSSVRITRGYKLVLLIAGILYSSLSHAQWGGFEGEDAEEEIDTETVSDSTDTPGDAAGADMFGGGGGGWGGFGGAEEEASKVDTLPAYERFIPPYDSLREMIFYEGVIEDWDCEFCMEDSLFARAERYFIGRYGKRQYKKFIVERKEFGLIWLKIELPMILQIGEYSKRPSGRLEFSLVLRLKEARYKYQFGNFAHITAPTGQADAQTKTYHEYYMKVKRGFRATDRYLLTADKEVKETIKGLKKALKEPYRPDEDDW